MAFNKYYYQISIEKVIDGDTLDVFFDLGFNLRNKVRVRCYGYDSPETWRPTTPKELEYGIRVKDYLISLLEEHKGNLTCLSTNIDLYGRAEGILFYTDKTTKLQISINDMMNQFMITNHLTKAESRLT